MVLQSYDIRIGIWYSYECEVCIIFMSTRSDEGLSNELSASFDQSELQAWLADLQTIVQTVDFSSLETQHAVGVACQNVSQRLRKIGSRSAVDDPLVNKFITATEELLTKVLHAVGDQALRAIVAQDMNQASKLVEFLQTLPSSESEVMRVNHTYRDVQEIGESGFHTDPNVAATAAFTDRIDLEVGSQSVNVLSQQFIDELTRLSAQRENIVVLQSVANELGQGWYMEKALAELRDRTFELVKRMGNEMNVISVKVHEMGGEYMPKRLENMLNGDDVKTWIPYLERVTLALLSITKWELYYKEDVQVIDDSYLVTLESDLQTKQTANRAAIDASEVEMRTGVLKNVWRGLNGKKQNVSDKAKLQDELDDIEQKLATVRRMRIVQPILQPMKQFIESLRTYIQTDPTPAK